MIHFRKSFPVFYAEFTSDKHEITPDLSGRHRERETLARSAGPRAVAADRAPLDAVPGICRGVEKAMIPARPVFLRVRWLILGATTGAITAIPAISAVCSAFACRSCPCMPGSLVPIGDGTLSSGGCTFCDNAAFSPSYCTPDKSVRRQLEEGIEFHRRRYRSAERYLAYFQSFSNTYAPLERLREVFSQAFELPEVAGIVGRNASRLHRRAEARLISSPGLGRNPLRGDRVRNRVVLRRDASLGQSRIRFRLRPAGPSR